MIYALWQGGDAGSYSPSDRERDLEVFDTVEDAAIEAYNRLRFGGRYRCDVRPVDGGPYATYFPAVSDTSYVEVWLEDPRGTDAEPDVRLVYDESSDEFVEEGKIS